MTPLRRRLLGLLAALALAGILIGLPATLLSLGGNPIPNDLPTWEELRAGLLSPDDGSVALAAITIIGWVAWLLLAAAIIAEAAAQFRGVPAVRLPGLRLPQLAAGHLVSTAALLFMTAPLLIHHQLPADAQPPASNTAQLSPSAPTAKPTNVARPTAVPPVAAAPGSATVPYTVRRGDTLWSIAQHHLGSGARYPAIVELNTDVIDGDPDFIAPGTVLRLPGTPDRDQKPRRAHRVTVERGDTLSGIAAEELGDPDRYPEIFRASTTLNQPGGQRLTDPDVIDIGWTLNIPGAATQPRSARQQADRDEESTPPTRITPRRDGQPTPKPTPSSQPTSPTSTTVPSAEQSAQPVIEDDDTEDGDRIEPAWLLTGLTGGGIVLAGSMWLALRQRRRAQYRNRRPGRTIKVPAPSLIPVEQTVTAIGDSSAPSVEQLDAVLRRLAAARTAAQQPMPRVAAIEPGPQTITLHLSEPDDPPDPWQASDDRLRWTVTTDVDLDQVGPDVADQPAPYPLLVTIGSTDTGNAWLLNCENPPVVNITGDPTYSHDLARYLAAELACNPWSAGVLVDCVGVAQEITAMNPDRIRSHQGPSDPAADLLADAVAMVDRADHAGADAATARAHQTGADPWPARLLLINADSPRTAALDQLLEVLDAAPHRTGTSVILTDEAEGSGERRGLVVQVTADGRVRLPHAGLDLVAVGLTSDEALGCAALLAAADDLDDTDIPERADADGWRTFANEAGAIRTAHTEPRTPPDADRESLDDESRETSSILDGADADYLEVAATTAEDLAVLAPRVPVDIRSAVADADPTLDDDVTAWFSDRCDRPRLTLLGPVGVRAHGTPISKRKPYYTELLTYLATRPHGATPEEVAEAFSITGPRVRNDVKVVRDWLGINPRTGRKHLPDARETAAAHDRGIGVYQIEDLLIDADLFRRLRVRGETRGPHGITDLRRALSLVTGQPLDQLRPGGWTWMFEGDRLDQHLLCAVVDVAHLVTTHALHQHDLPVARAAAELAALAAPFEEIPRLDLAAVAAAQGQHDEADRIVRDDVCNRTDDNLPPTELSQRTATILRARDWPRQRKAAS